jgi:hypothetical protein
MVNFLIMLVIWSANSSSYYIVNFYLKYLPGDIFLNSAGAGVSEIVAVLLAGYIYLKVGLKKGLFMSYVISAIGAVLIMIFFYEKRAMPILVLVAKFGVSGAFGLIYVSNMIFPVEFAS